MGKYGVAYNSACDRIIALAQDLTEDDLRRMVPACPRWSVRDLYAHIAGVAADFTTGNLADVGQPQWTGAQVAVREDKGVDEITAELTELGAHIDNVLDDIHPAIAGILLADTVTHEHDLRAALNKPGARDAPDLCLALDTYARFFGRRMKENWLPPLGVVAGSQSWELGNGPPSATLKAEPFELYRALGGRRTDDEIRSLGWECVPDPYLRVFSMYGKPERSLGE